jgi:hypothetical protein
MMSSMIAVPDGLPSRDSELPASESMTPAVGPVSRLEPLSTEAVALLVPLAQLLIAEMEIFISNQYRMISEYRPAMYRNEPFMGTVQNICEDNIVAFSRLLSSYPEFDTSVIPRAEAFARGSAASQYGITLSELLDLYRRGQAQLFQDLLTRMFTLFTPGPALNETLNYSTACWNGYIDVALTHTVAGFVNDQERLRISAQRRKQQIVDGLLTGGDIDITKASTQLGYDLRAQHLGLVVRQPDARNDEALEQLAGRFGELGARAIDARHTLVLTRDQHEAWVWFGTGEFWSARTLTALRRPAEQLALRVTAGRPAQGLAGFVTANQEARWADRTVSQVSGVAPVTGYESVSALSLVELDKRHITAFVRHELAGLAVRDRRTQQLRETVAVFLREGRSARRTAEVLNTHKNTVIYRVGKAEEMMGRSLHDGTFELELALRLAQLYGDWTLTD